MKSKLIVLLACVLIIGCKNKKTEETTEPESLTAGAVTPSPDINNTFAFSVLGKLKGIWSGPVSSTTPLGGYPEWIVDFRPVSENQISAKNELDTLNDIHMSFFIAKYNNEYRVFFRNGGSFAGMKRVSYFKADSVSEITSQSFYRFTELIKGKSRAFTEVIFRSDSLYIRSYTNKYNSQPSSTPTWFGVQSSVTQAPASQQLPIFYFQKRVLQKILPLLLMDKQKQFIIPHQQILIMNLLNLTLDKLTQAIRLLQDILQLHPRKCF